MSGEAVSITVPLKMTVEEAHVIIAEFTKNLSCYRCIHAGVEGCCARHEVDVCRHPDHYWEDYDDGCDEFVVNPSSFEFHYDLDTLHKAVQELPHNTTDYGTALDMAEMMLKACSFVYMNGLSLKNALAMTIATEIQARYGNDKTNTDEDPK